MRIAPLHNLNMRASQKMDHGVESITVACSLGWKLDIWIREIHASLSRAWMSEPLNLIVKLGLNLLFPRSLCYIKENQDLCLYVGYDCLYNLCVVLFFCHIILCRFPWYTDCRHLKSTTHYYYLDTELTIKIITWWGSELLKVVGLPFYDTCIKILINAYSSSCSLRVDWYFCFFYSDSIGAYSS